MHKKRLAVNFYFFVNGFVYANWVARLPKFQELYGMNNSQTGLALLAIAIGALIAMPFTGWIIMKNGSRRATIVASIIFCVLVPFAAIMGSLSLLVVLFFFMGIATGIMDVGMNAQAVLVEKLYQKPIMSSFHAVFSGGMMFGAGTGALFTKWQVPLFIHILLVTLFSLCFILWSAFHLVKDQPEGNTEASIPFQRPTKALWGVGVIAFCCMLGEGAMADWSTNYMRNIALSDAALAPIGLGAFSSAMMIGRMLGDKGRILFGDEQLLVINSLLATIGILFLIAFPTTWAVIGSLFLIGLGLSVIVPIAYSTAGSVEGLAPGVGISMVTTIGYAGFLFGPPIIGFLADWQTLRTAMILVGMLFVVMTIISFGRQKVKG